MDKLVLKNFDVMCIHRCVYCRGSGEENMFICFGRYDDNPSIDFNTIVGHEVEIYSYSGNNRGKFQITANESNPKTGTNVAMLVGRKLCDA